MKSELITGIFAQTPKCNILWVYFMILFIITAILLVILREKGILNKTIISLQNGSKRAKRGVVE
jgi:hypothetical protein